MRVGVRERSETVVIFLSCGIPECQLDVFSINLYIGNVVLKDSWNVDLLNLSAAILMAQSGYVGSSVS